jgi:hypothetical protein
MIPPTKSKYKSMAGRYKLNNPSKYTGKQLPIFKSKLEAKLMLYLDMNPNVVSWSYEPFAIGYFDPTAKRNRKYFIDFVAEIKDNKGRVFKYWIEAKYKGEAKKPGKSYKNINRALENTKLYMTNSAKWSAAKAMARRQGAEFIIITEDFFSNKTVRAAKKWVQQN